MSEQAPPFFAAMPLVFRDIKTAPKIPGRQILTFGKIPGGAGGFEPDRFCFSVSTFAGWGADHEWNSQADNPYGRRFMPMTWAELPDFERAKQ